MAPVRGNDGLGREIPACAGMTGWSAGMAFWVARKNRLGLSDAPFVLREIEGRTAGLGVPGRTGGRWTGSGRGREIPACAGMTGWSAGMAFWAARKNRLGLSDAPFVLREIEGRTAGLGVSGRTGGRWTGSGPGGEIPGCAGMTCWGAGMTRWGAGMAFWAARKNRLGLSNAPFVLREIEGRMAGLGVPGRTDGRWTGSGRGREIPASAGMTGWEARMTCWGVGMPRG